MQKKNFDQYLMPYSKINLKGMSDLNTKPKIYKNFRRQKITLRLDKDFLDMTLKSLSINYELIYWTSSKLKTSL